MELPVGNYNVTIAPILSFLPAIISNVTVSLGLTTDVATIVL